MLGWSKTWSLYVDEIIDNLYNNINDLPFDECRDMIPIEVHN